MRTVGSYEAKTHLARLLDEVADGGTVTITRHGRAVARLVPVSDAVTQPAEAIDQLRSARVGVTLGDVTVRELLDEGRR